MDKKIWNPFDRCLKVKPMKSWPNVVFAIARAATGGGWAQNQERFRRNGGLASLSGQGFGEGFVSHGGDITQRANNRVEQNSKKTVS